MEHEDLFKHIKFGTEEFRTYFRERYVGIDAGLRFLKFRNGKLYGAFILSLLGTSALTSLALIDDWRMSFLWLFVFGFIVANFFEYLIHRFPMHRKMSSFKPMFEHVTVHHNFFNETNPYRTKSADNMAVFLPLLFSFGITALIVTIAGIVSLLIDLDHGLFFAGEAYAYYLAYEILHFAYHSPPQSRLRKLPLVDKLSVHHLRHHQISLMQHWNFNITLPLFDWIFGTYKQEEESQIHQKPSRSDQKTAPKLSLD